MVENGRKRTRADGRSSPIARRSKFEIGYIVSEFSRQVVGNDGCCTSCGKEIMSLNEQAEFEFNVTRETVVKHADRKCVHRRRPVLNDNIAIEGRDYVDEGGGGGGEQGGEEGEEEQEEQEDEERAEQDIPDDSWETNMLLNENPIQAGGSRQTGLMVRNNLQTLVRPQGKTLAEVLHGILSKDRPVHVIEDMLEVARECTNNKYFPRSFHVLKKALHMRSLDSVDIHICGACWKFAWKPVEKANWPTCDTQCTCEFCTCPKCLQNGKISKRFEQDLSGRLAPRHNCYYFGLEHQINAMYANENFRNSRRHGKTFNKVGSWWSSEHVRWINSQTGGRASPENDLPMQQGLGEAFQYENGVYSLHFDWVQVCRMGRKSYSVGMIVLRCDDVEESKLNTDEWSMPLMVIPGPKEPPSMDIHWQIIQSQFDEYSTGSRNLTISYTDRDNAHEYVHRPFLVRVCCDAVARHKLLKCRHASAKLVCPWCWTTSSNTDKSRIYGYASRVVSPEYNWDDLLRNGVNSNPISEREIQLGVTDPQIYKVTMEQHAQRSSILEYMESNKDRFNKTHVDEVCKWLGLSGKCHISWNLKTLHPLEFVHLPLYHILFLGIVKDFLKHVFRPDNSGVEQHEDIVPNSRGVNMFAKARRMILLNCDVNDPCIDLNNISSWLISSLVAFVEVHSCFMFNEKVMGVKVLGDVARKAWGHLRHAVMYFLRDPEDEMTMEDWKCGNGKRLRDTAKQNLIEYAKICEQYMPSLCVSNLHISICRLFDQEEYSGRPNICHDLFTERVVRKLKKFSYRKDHEKSFVYRQLYREGCMEMAREYSIGGGELTGNTTREGDQYDISTSGTYLMGSGKECYPFDGIYQQTKAMHESIMNVENVDGNLMHSHAESYKIYRHSELCLKHQDRFETIKSISCLKEVNRNSKVVLIRIEGEERLALVETYSRLVLEGRTLSRFVLCHIFNNKSPDNDPDTGKLYRYRHSGSMPSSSVCASEYCDEDFEERDVILPVESIIGKVVQFISPVLHIESETGREYHMVYCARSRSRSGQKQGGLSWLPTE